MKIDAILNSRIPELKLTKKKIDEFKSVLNEARKQQDINRLKEACMEFEAMFIHAMLKAMRKTIIKSGLFTAGIAENIFQDMLDEKYAEKVAKAGSFGIGDRLFKELSKQLL